MGGKTKKCLPSFKKSTQKFAWIGKLTYLCTVLKNNTVLEVNNRSIRLTVRTADSQSANTSSILVWSTKAERSSKAASFFVLSWHAVTCRAARVETRCGAVMKRREWLRRLPGRTACMVLCCGVFAEWQLMAGGVRSRRFRWRLARQTWAAGLGASAVICCNQYSLENATAGLQSCNQGEDRRLGVGGALERVGAGVLSE